MYAFGVGLPRSKIFLFNPETFFNGSNKSTILHGVNKKRPLLLIFFTNIDSGAAVQRKCDLNENEFSRQECQILCELRSDLVICCPVK